MTNLEFDNHAIHESVTLLKESIANISVNELDDDNAWRVEKLLRATSFIEKYLENTSKLLAPDSHLTKISNSLISAVNQINTYLANVNSIVQLDYACKSIDIAILDVGLLIASPSESHEETKGVIESIRSIAQNRITDLKDREQSLSAQIDELSERIDTLKNEIIELDASSKSFIDDKENDISDLMKKVNDDYLSLNDLFVAEQKNTLSNSEERIEAQISEINVDAEVVKNTRHKAEEILGLIGNIGLAGSYQISETQHKTDADKWRIWAISLFLLAAIISSVSLFIVSIESLSEALMRFFSGFVLLVPGLYCANQAAIHRRLNIMDQRVKLELSSLDAYINDLPDTSKKEIRENLVDSYFGKSIDFEKKHSIFSSGRIDKKTLDSISNLRDDVKNLLDKNE